MTTTPNPSLDWAEAWHDLVQHSVDPQIVAATPTLEDTTPAPPKVQWRFKEGDLVKVIGLPVSESSAFSAFEGRKCIVVTRFRKRNIRGYQYTIHRLDKNGMADKTWEIADEFLEHYVMIPKDGFEDNWV